MEAPLSESAELIHRGLVFGLLAVLALSVLIWLIYRVIVARLAAESRASLPQPMPLPYPAEEALTADGMLLEPQATPQAGTPVPLPVGQKAEVVQLSSRQRPRRRKGAAAHARHPARLPSD